MAKTREEVEQLKRDWIADPCWDIEDTDGFEDFRSELYEFRNKTETEWKLKEAKRLEERTEHLKWGCNLVKLIEVMEAKIKVLEEQVEVLQQKVYDLE